MLPRHLTAFAILAGMLAPMVAQAHATKETTTPDDGAALAESPSVIGMDFDAPMRVTMIELVDGSGAAFELERTDAMAPVVEFRAIPPELPPGNYAVRWRGLAADGHAMEGSFAFVID